MLMSHTAACRPPSSSWSFKNIVIALSMLAWMISTISVSMHSTNYTRDLISTIPSSFGMFGDDDVSKNNFFGTDSCLTDGCYHVFIDAGSNRGVHGRFVFEPEMYPSSKFATSKAAEFFGSGDRKQQNICVVALEPNPRHANVQRATASAYSFMGWRYYYLPYGVSDQFGELTFYRNGDTKKEEWGFSIKQHKADATKIVVPIMDIVAFLNQYIFCRTIPPPVPENQELPPRVVVKFDIEGSEYQVWMRMIEAAKEGILNLTQIDYMFGESHPRFNPLVVRNQTYNTTKDLKMLFKLLVRELHAAGGPIFQEFDDEQYLHDGIRYPQPIQ